MSQDLRQIRVEPEYEGDDVKPLKEQDLTDIPEEPEEEEDDDEELDKDLQEFIRMKEEVEKKKEAMEETNNKKEEETENAAEEVKTKSRSRTNTATKKEKKLAKKRKSDAIDKGEPIDIIFPNFEWARSKEESPKKKQKLAENEENPRKEKDMDAPVNATKHRVQLNQWAKSLPKYKNMKSSSSGLFTISQIEDAKETTSAVKTQDGRCHRNQCIAPGARFITKFISLAQVVRCPV